MSAKYFISQKNAIRLDENLLKLGYNIEQLMELAGLSVASAINKNYKNKVAGVNRNVLVLCGPGNNGTDFIR